MMPSVADLVRERFGELTPIQKIAMPNVLAGKNVLVLAPTGSGKTESVLLPILEKIKTSANQGTANQTVGIRALYITPLRALSRDLKQRFNWWCDRLEITHDIRTGDTTQAERAKHRAKPPQVLLTTVESLQALLMGRVMRKHLSTIEFVIVDEIHDILDNKRGAQLSLGLERLDELIRQFQGVSGMSRMPSILEHARDRNVDRDIPGKLEGGTPSGWPFQRIGISATVANESEAAKLLFGEREFEICESGKNREIDVTVEELPNEKRLEKIKELSEKFRSLVFVNTRSTAEEIGASLKKLNAPIGVHHGSLAKEVRLTTEDDFKSGKINSILCTSSLELGIDVGDVSLVIQYGSPHQVFRLIQRVGRAGHSLTKTPKGIIFNSDFDDRLESEVISVLAKNNWMEDKKAERGALDVIAHQLIGISLDFGRIELSKAHSILSRSYAYGINFNKLRMIALQLYGEGLIYYDEDPKEVFIKTKPRARIYYADFLSTIPKTKKFAMRDISSNRFISSLDEEFVVNLESGSSFLSHGMAWRVIDITDKEVLAEPTSGLDIMVPSWTGEDIPVSFEVAQDVGRMRKVKKDITPLPDDKTVVVEMVEDLVVIHACFGTRLNDTLSRVFSKQLSNLIGENVTAVSDPYRILIKLPFPIKEDSLKRAFDSIHHVKNQLVDALEFSSLLKFKFLHVGRMFGLLSPDANPNSRYIQMMRNSVVYEETIRSIFFRYFDVDKTEEILRKIRNGQIKLVYDIRKKPSYFAQIGLERVSGAESIGAFEPRERIVSAFKENALSKTLRLVCLNCDATRFMHLAGAPDKITCHKCNQQSLALVNKEGEAKHDLEFSAGLIRAYGKQALIALSTYGIGPQTADRVLKRLHKTEEAFYLDLIEAQKNFIKNKKYWKL